MLRLLRGMTGARELGEWLHRTDGEERPDPTVVTDHFDVRIVEGLNMDLIALQLSCMKWKFANLKLKSIQCRLARTGRELGVLGWGIAVTNPAIRLAGEYCGRDMCSSSIQREDGTSLDSFNPSMIHNTNFGL
jgi:hypothetical protein